MASTGVAAVAAERNDAGSSFTQKVSQRRSRLRAGATVVLTVWFCWLATARPGRADARFEISFWTSLDQLREAQRLFAEDCGNGGYATSIDQVLVVLDNVSSEPPFLGEARSDVPGRHAGVEIELRPRLGASSGPRDCRDRPTTTQYYASATLRRSYWHGPSFAMGTDGVIWRSDTEEPPREPLGPPATAMAR